MHRKTRSAQITSLRPQWTAARWFSRVETQYSALVAAVRREIVQWSFNRACAEQSVRRDKPRPNNSASLSASARLPQRQITRNGPASIWLPVLLCVRAHDAYSQYALCSARVSSGNAKSGNRASYARPTRRYVSACCNLWLARKIDLSYAKWRTKYTTWVMRENIWSIRWECHGLLESLALV